MDPTAELIIQSCRICLNDITSGVLIFSEEGRRQHLEAKVRKYLYITVSIDDKLPKVICDGCCKRLDSVHKFATMANKNQVTLLNETKLIDCVEPKQVQNRGLLHTYLTRGANKDIECATDTTESTELEIGLDPMMLVQCSLEEDDIDSPSFPYISISDEFDEKCESENCSDNSETYNMKPHKHKSYCCSLCPRRFASEFNLLVHMWSHPTQNKRILLNKNQEEYENHWTEMNNKSKDEISPFSPFTLTLDDIHMSTPEKTKTGGIRYACPVCGKVVSTKGNLKVHVETHRPKGKYACDICGRIFKTQCNLHRHKEYHGFPQYPCVVCGRVYPTNSTLRAHSITHSDVRPHKCPLCIKTFKRNQDLKFHINQHTGARPYQCPYCPKAFASSGNCFSHRKRMHPMEVERDRERAAKIMR